MPQTLYSTNLPDAKPAAIPFFIFGSGRSGSTLLGRMLNNHPRLAVPGESHLFDTFYNVFKHYGDLSKRVNQEQFVDDILATFQVRTWHPPLDKAKFLSQIKAPTFAGIMDAMMRSWTLNQGKQRWGEKTPHHFRYWREILECFPNAKLIHIVRDGRDVANSYMSARFGPKTTYMAAKRWVSWLQRIDELTHAVAPNQFLEIRYEDILKEPKLELTKICEYLGESFSSDMLKFHRNALSDNVTDSSNRRNLRGPLLPENAQKWRKNCSKAQLHIFEAVAQPMLVRHGYEVVFQSQPTLSRYQHFYHQAIENPIYKVPAMATNLPGLIDTWIRLKIGTRLRLVDRFFRN